MKSLVYRKMRRSYVSGKLMFLYKDDVSPKVLIKTVWRWLTHHSVRKKKGLVEFVMTTIGRKPIATDFTAYDHHMSKEHAERLAAAIMLATDVENSRDVRPPAWPNPLSYTQKKKVIRELCDLPCHKQEVQQ